MLGTAHSLHRLWEACLLKVWSPAHPARLRGHGEGVKRNRRGALTSLLSGEVLRVRNSPRVNWCRYNWRQGIREEERKAER